MSNIIINKNLDNLVKDTDLSIQSDMKKQLGLDIYESWLKKIDFAFEFNNYILLSY